MNGPVSGSILEQIGMRTAKTSAANSMNDLQTTQSKSIQRSLCLCETKIANLVAIRSQVFVMYNSFESKGTPEAKVIADNYLTKLLAMDEQFADAEKEKKKLELSNQEFKETVGLAMDKKLKNYVLEEDKKESTVTLKTNSVDNNLLGLNIMSNGDSSNHLSDLSKTPEDLSTA